MFPNISIDEAIEILHRTRNWDDELNNFFGLLNQFDFVERQEFSRRVFQYLIGYTSTRKAAGLLVIKEHPRKGWEILSLLVESSNPDDRDAALEIIQELKDPRGEDLLRRLLSDPYPYIQLDACEYLLFKLPQEVHPILQKLQKHDLDWVREEAENLLNRTS